MKFEVEDRPISWNTYYAGKHWSQRKVLSDQWKWRVKTALLRNNIPKEPITESCEINFIVYVKRPIDCDNIVLKTYIDGLRDWGLLPDDSPRWVRKISVCVVAKSEREYTEIEILI